MPFFLFPCLMEQAAHQEKSHAALSSVLWSAFLTLIKLWAGIVTGSLGIISEALHSGLDLIDNTENCVEYWRYKNFNHSSGIDAECTQYTKRKRRSGRF